MMLIQLVVILAVIGVILWAIEQIPMDGTIRKIIRVVVVVVVCLWLLGLVGVLPIGDVRLIR